MTTIKGWRRITMKAAESGWGYEMLNISGLQSKSPPLHYHTLDAFVT